MDTKIPVIDLANLEKGQPTVEQTIAIGKACLEFGFFYVVNHGIGEELKGKVFEKLWQFFNLSTEKKGEIHRHNGFRGYFTKGEEHSIEYGCVEWKEGIYYFREFNNVPQGRRERVFCGSNPWPKDEYVPRFQTVIWEYFEKTQALASKLLGCMAIFLGWYRRKLKFVSRRRAGRYVTECLSRPSLAKILSSGFQVQKQSFSPVNFHIKVLSELKRSDFES